MSLLYNNIQGLSYEQVLKSKKQYGENTIKYQSENEFISLLKRTFSDPMVIILMVASFIYFISHQVNNGIFLLIAVSFQSGISLYQYQRSKNALEKLKDLSQPYCKVIRAGRVENILSKDLVIGDKLIVEEGASITADGEITKSHDFSTNESILTGESMPVFKSIESEDPMIYSGTAVMSGQAVVTVTQIGLNTKIGQLGTSIEEIKEEKTPLELQISNFVTKMVQVGGLVFFTVWAINYFHTLDFISSLLQSLTIAMSILPEEIPITFTTFMALGAWRMIKKDVLVKQMKTVETLGSATVICIDKTGTITENSMSLAKLYLLSANKIFQSTDVLTIPEKKLIELAMWASEPSPYNPMEIALHQVYKDSISIDDRSQTKLIHEYALDGQPPMMTHVYKKKNGEIIIASKGAPEAIMNVSALNEQEKLNIRQAIQNLATHGYRILAVGVSHFKGEDFPMTQQELPFEFVGLVTFYDPPKKNIQKVLVDFYNAGIAVKIITGDSPETAISIAKQIGFRGVDHVLTGEELMKLNDTELQSSVMQINLFTRMFPEAKLRIINALKSSHQIVAMTGDGVNDGPALKSAHIGIAMGIKGSEIAKQAASLILMKDDLSKMVLAIAIGRKIYANLKKAIQYVISIHIPIILIVFIPLVLGWKFLSLFSPIHIIFLEIIMGPTCSIIYENEPIEKNTMFQKPKAMTTTFFNWKELTSCIIQGLVIAIGSLFLYYYSMHIGNDEYTTRTMTFTSLIIANIALTLTNRSSIDSLWYTLQYKNSLVGYIVLTTIVLLCILLFIRPVRLFFEFAALDFYQLMTSITVGMISVLWIELLKWYKRITKNKKEFVRKLKPDAPILNH